MTGPPGAMSQSRYFVYRWVYGCDVCDTYCVTCVHVERYTLRCQRGLLDRAVVAT